MKERKHAKAHLIWLIGVTISTIFIAVPASGQDLHESGSEYLKARFPEKADLPETFKFDREQISDGITILESDHPPCFIAFLTGETECSVAAYSTHNLFGIGRICPYPAMDLLKEIRDTPPQKANLKTGAARKHSTIGPLLKTHWDQGKWYNRFCPYHMASLEEDHVPAGCMAVAMGQIVRFYGKWNNFIIDEKYTCYTIGGQELCANSTGYNWAGMINIPVSYDPEICRLLSDIGILVHMNYGSLMSTQGSGYARKALNKIGYVNAASIQKYNYDREQWLGIFYSNLDKYNPVLVQGTGHAFVCDGYNEEGMLHFNLGLGGPGDGFYDPGAVAGKYYVNDAIIDIFPGSDYQAPGSLRREASGLSDYIVWSLPPTQQGIKAGFNVYYSDDDYFFTKDTAIRVESLRPGTHGIMVSAQYGEAESLWIGPLTVYVPGERFTTFDPELIKSIAEQMEDVNPDSDYLNVDEGRLADMACIKIAGLVQSTDLLNRMPNLQALELNCAGLEKDDLKFIGGLNSLQTLKLKNLKREAIPDLGNNSKLVELSLDSCKLKDISSLSVPDKLFFLELKDCEIDARGLDCDLPLLETLIISNMSLTKLFPLSKYPNLRKLEATGCQLAELDLSTDLPNLKTLVLDNNKISSVSFLSHMPGLNVISMVGNRVDKLEISSEFACLTKMDFSFNRISDAALLSGAKNLVEWNLSHNNLKKIPEISLAASKLKVLNLSYNSIRNFQSTRIHSLKNLDLSFNRLNHLSGIDLLEGLTTLNLSSNAASDFSPFLRGEACRNLFDLDIRENPVSKQSFLEVLPVLKGKIALFKAPGDYERNSPCFPQPESPSVEEKGSGVDLSWYCESSDPQLSYNVFLLEGNEPRLAYSELETNHVGLELDVNQIYSWQVEAILPDTSFFSGVYEIRTAELSQLPYRESFDYLTAGDSLTAASPVWRLANGFNGAGADGMITDVSYLGGEGNGLHVQNSTQVSVDFDKTEAAAIIVEYNHYLIPGKGSRVRLKNISGLNVDIFSDGYRSAVFLNGFLIDYFDVLSDSWNHFKFSTSAISGMLYLKCNGIGVISIGVSYPRNRIYIGSVEIVSGNDGLNEINCGEFESYIDNMAVYDPYNQTNTIDCQTFENPIQLAVYPNPAADCFFVAGFQAAMTECFIELRNSIGQLIFAQKEESPGSKMRISTRNIPPGIYYYLIRYNDKSSSRGKIIIIK